MVIIYRIACVAVFFLCCHIYGINKNQKDFLQDRNISEFLSITDQFNVPYDFIVPSMTFITDQQFSDLMDKIDILKSITTTLQIRAEKDELTDLSYDLIEMNLALDSYRSNLLESKYLKTLTSNTIVLKFLYDSSSIKTDINDLQNQDLCRLVLNNIYIQVNTDTYCRK